MNELQRVIEDYAYSWRCNDSKAMVEEAGRLAEYMLNQQLYTEEDLEKALEERAVEVDSDWAQAIERYFERLDSPEVDTATIVYDILDFMELR